MTRRGGAQASRCVTPRCPAALRPEPDAGVDHRSPLADRTGRDRDPVWRHWHVFAKLPEKDFANQAARANAQLNRDDVGNRLVREAFAVNPKSMHDVAAIGIESRCLRHVGTDYTAGDRNLIEARRSESIVIAAADGVRSPERFNTCLVGVLVLHHRANPDDIEIVSA